MNKGLNLFYVIALMVIFFASCSEDEDTVLENAPEISITSPTADTTEVFIGESLAFSVDLSSENTLNSFQTLSSSNEVTLTNDTKNFTTEAQASVDVEATVSATATDGGVIALSFVVTDEAKQSSVKKYIKAKKKAISLSAEEDLAWERVGGAVATGLSMFGLSWTENTATSAIIVKDAEKFVKLASTDWTNITSQEALKIAIDAAVNINQFNEISAQDQSKSYDITLGTIKSGVYYLIHIIKSTVSVASDGTTIKVDGKYKK